MRHYEPAGVLIGLLPRRIIAEIRCGLPQVDNAQHSHRPPRRLVRQRQGAEEVAEVVGERVQLEPDGVGGKGVAGQPGPPGRRLALLDPLLRRAAVVVDGIRRLPPPYVVTPSGALLTFGTRRIPREWRFAAIPPGLIPASVCPDPCRCGLPVVGRSPRCRLRLMPDGSGHRLGGIICLV
jgi:hypothetical protein